MGVRCAYTRFVTHCVAVSESGVGERIRAWREDAGMSLDTLYARVTHLLPESMWGSTELLRRIEKGDKRPDPFYAAAIAKALGHDLFDLSPELAQEAATLAHLADLN